MFDCIIIGAGPAGASAAYHLAKNRYSVLLIEKAALPRAKACSGGVSPVIAKWFDFDFSEVIDNRISRVQYTWKLGDPVATELNLAEPMWIVQRDRFDYFLVQQAQKQGAQLLDNSRVVGITKNSDGWQVKTNQETFNGRYIIGADGATGLASQWLGLGDAKEALPAVSVKINSKVPSENLSTAFFDFGLVKNGYIWNFPTHDGYSISAGYLKGKGKVEDLKTALKQYVLNLGFNLDGANVREGALNVWTENRPLHTFNALLAGEAVGVLDPLIGEGIRPSIYTGVQAAAAIDKALQGNSQALPNYSETIKKEWGSDMVLAQRLAGLFYQFPQIAYKVGVKRPRAGQTMGRILCGELRYRDVTDQAIQKLKKSLIPGMG